MRILITMPHFFGDASALNRSTQAGARDERVRALVAAVSSLHQALGAGTYGLDHGQRTAWPMAQPARHVLDLVIVTTGSAHLVNELRPLQPMFRHHATNSDPLMLGFECHKLLRDACGGYDYYAYVENDMLVIDPLLLCKRRLFDQAFGPHALLQPNRYEASPVPPVHKLYVDYRLDPRVTARYQNLADTRGSNFPFSTTPSPSRGLHIRRPAASSSVTSNCRSLQPVYISSTATCPISARSTRR